MTYYKVDWRIIPNIVNFAQLNTDYRKRNSAKNTNKYLSQIKSKISRMIRKS